jgi:hypothetical protein
MLLGSADLGVLAAAAPQLLDYADEPVCLGGVVCLQMTVEMRNTARESVLPPSLHPTIPPALSIQAWSVADSPWGSFRLVSTRVSCRSGVRARGFTTSVIVDSEPVRQVLRTRYGYPAEPGDVQLRHGYDGADLQVRAGGKTALRIGAVAPEPLGGEDVQYTTTLNLAHAPAGLRLVQVETAHETSRVERLRGRLLEFVAAAWGEPRLAPYHPIATSLAQGQIVLQPIRFVCRPDELAFTGTEAVTRAG